MRVPHEQINMVDAKQLPAIIECRVIKFALSSFELVVK
jgi:hypothetical protein